MLADETKSRIVQYRGLALGLFQSVRFSAAVNMTFAMAFPASITLFFMRA